ncbi:actin-related protein 8-like [Ruditapes philippinarum]|uniref:actin-related protein 8-like n=1 Tax=Ruditapes philippinarum TaxID=129788 RepID=UPI00295B1EC9|nr:actin-related protein 8-like [Ruditapes philippinarum]
MPVNTSKRLYTQVASECIHEPVQVNTVVVIHPGSLNLRIGRASDTFPVTIPHCIARKRKDNSIPEYRTPWMIRKEKEHSGARKQRDQGLKAANESLEGKPMDSGEYRPPSSVKQLHSNNVRVRGQRTDVPSPFKWTNTDRNPQFVIGDEAMYIKPGTGYSINWPVRRGRLNLHDGPGGTVNAVMADIESIWGTALETFLDIPVKDLKYYKALLLIPDVYTHMHIREMMNVLLNRLGFGAAIVHQESVCGAFGAGVPTGCIVDVGDQKTSVCCVEDGISQRKTRLTMETGGSDISRMFLEMLNTLGFNPALDLRFNPDSLLIQELKEKLCHLDHNRYGYLEESIQIKRPGENIIKYLIQIGDELVLAPLSLFFPDMLALQGENLCRLQKRNEGDPADPHDDFYLKQVQTRQDPATKMSKKKDNQDTTREGPDLTLDESGLNVLQDEDSNDMPESMAMTDTTKTRRGEGEEEMEEESTVEQVTPPLMGLDEAVLYSIDKCDSDDMKKKMYSCIVVVGGGFNFESTQPWLQYCIWKNMPGYFRPLLETMDVITRPKELDPQIVAWKGAAILACLDTTQELWIKQKEWHQFDVRMLRERAPFVW